MLDEATALPNDPEDLRAFTARLLAQAILIEKLRQQFAGHRAHRFPPAPRPARLAVRANAIRLRSGDGPLAGRVLSAAYLGDHMEYEIDTPLGRLFAIDADSETPHSRGSRVALEFRPRGLALID